MQRLHYGPVLGSEFMHVSLRPNIMLSLVPPPWLDWLVILTDATWQDDQKDKIKGWFSALAWNEPKNESRHETAFLSVWSSDSSETRRPSVLGLRRPLCVTHRSMVRQFAPPEQIKSCYSSVSMNFDLNSLFPGNETLSFFFSLQHCGWKIKTEKQHWNECWSCSTNTQLTLRKLHF